MLLVGTLRPVFSRDAGHPGTRAHSLPRSPGHTHLHQRTRAYEVAMMMMMKFHWNSQSTVTRTRDVDEHWHANTLLPFVAHDDVADDDDAHDEVEGHDDSSDDSILKATVSTMMVSMTF